MTRGSPSRKDHARTLSIFRRAVRGSISTEYVVVLGTVGLVAVAGLLTFGPQVRSAYQHARQVLAQPAP